MPGRSIRIARIAGIPVGVSPWWLVIVVLITWSLAVGYYPDAVPGISSGAAYGLGFASALLLFASILAHEFGHALVARAHGLVIEEIDLWLLGGVARMRGRPRTAGDELSFALAGPAVTAVIAAIFTALAFALPNSVPAALRAVIEYQAEINAIILVFNLLPAFPLDGGRVARALLWRHSGNIRAATDTAAAVGRGFGYLLIAAGFFLMFSGATGGLWFSVIGVFLIAAASAERLQEEVIATFTGTRAIELMSAPVVSVMSHWTLSQAQHYFERYKFAAFPVIDPTGRAIGLVTIDWLQRTQRSEWDRLIVGELAERDPALLVRPQEDVAHLLEQPVFTRIGRAVVIDDEGKPIGLLSVTDIERALRARRLRGGAGGSSSLASHP